MPITTELQPGFLLLRLLIGSHMPMQHNLQRKHLPVLSSSNSPMRFDLQHFHLLVRHPVLHKPTSLLTDRLPMPVPVCPDLPMRNHLQHCHLPVLSSSNPPMRFDLQRCNLLLHHPNLQQRSPGLQPTDLPVRLQQRSELLVRNNLQFINLPVLSLPNPPMRLDLQHCHLLIRRPIMPALMPVIQPDLMLLLQPNLPRRPAVLHLCRRRLLHLLLRHRKVLDLR